MTARILVVDDLPANVKLLESRLLAEYYDVVSAPGGEAALDICQSSNVDIVLLDVMMPGIDGFEVCRRLKADPKTMNIPVVMVTALDRPQDRIRGLEAGADDFLTKPVNDLQLLSRVKSLARLKTLSDELLMRATSARETDIETLLLARSADSGGQADLLIVDEDGQAAARLKRLLVADNRVDTVSEPSAALLAAVEGNYDCVIVSTGFSSYDPLRLCSQMRAIERTRLLPVILIADPGEAALVARGLDLGVNDYSMRPLDRNELLARVRTQVKRKRYNDLLRKSLSRTIEMAVTDSLTGLHNRRYLDSHMPVLFARSVSRERPLSLLIIDMDHFKRINDTFGHDAGDDVLRDFAGRLNRNIRGIDLACRYGGEEFVVALPDTDQRMAAIVAERIRGTVASTPFTIRVGTASVDVTISIGIASLQPRDDSVEKLFKRADTALYEAKRSGRNRVVGAVA
ncbi:PleD family two-component system response regulator [Phyllobacterium leguminum]|uniref:diguanylate cyclase n=1 Tax=Phyllobacterium leguminum TaxID=314237 RepID=A0A318T8H6_9HYPH|nr:PleD family two-component system response regulator [Phyllobacterium leguminum]PYE89698.1 response regulator receiver modulated diguanylate cyclase [Phyllobacterium leguminum]